MRARVGYSPWPGWQCWIVLPAPWWFQPLIVFLEVWAARFEGWPTVHDLIWRPRRALMDWRQRRWPVVWWEYRCG